MNEKNVENRGSLVAKRLLQGLLASTAIFHLVVGGSLWLSADFQAWATPQYLTNIELTSQSVYLVRIVGAFAASLGVFAAFAIPDPWSRRHIVYGLVVFVCLRNVDRFLFYSEIHQAFGVGWSKNMQTFFATGIVAVAMLVCLWFLRPSKRSETTSH